LAATDSERAAAENLLTNGELAAPPGKALPTDWWTADSPQKLSSDHAEAPPGASQSLRVDIVATARHYGQVGQSLRDLKPNTTYNFEGWLRGTANRVACFQIKRLRQKKELERITTEYATTEWRKVTTQVFTGDADRIDVLCRWQQKEKYVGETGWFALLRLTEAPPPKLTGMEAVPTFHCIGVSVSYEGGLSKGARCRIRRRKQGSEAWRQGLDLIPYPPDRQFRGSLFWLEPNTEYEMECRLIDPAADKGHISLRTTAITWSEDVPVAETKHLPAGVSHEPLVIKDTGAPDAWVRYAPPPGRACTINAAKSAENAVRIEDSAYVLLEDVTVRGGSADGVFIARSHHIRIIGCDIAGWGDAGTRKEGLEKGLYVDARGRLINGQAGVQLHRDCSQVVVERCFIHAPRGTANSWKFGHPMGPQGINLSYTAGNNVIRYNDLIGSETHWWNDAIEGAPNRAVEGGPHRDTDIYGNVLAFANDDGTELDGGQINVRYWHNWIDKALCGVSCAPNRRGPSYVFRNLIVLTGDEHFVTGAGFKMGGDRYPHPGLSLLLHNTVYSARAGLTAGHYGKGPTPIRSRNNLFMGDVPGRAYIRYRHVDGGDFDYDLVPRGGVSIEAPGREAHAVVGYPKVRDAGARDFRLLPGSPGVDAAVRLSGLTDGFTGTGPDIGAFEHGQSERIFPRRPDGMQALPLRVELEHFIGARRGEGKVTLHVPPSAGTRWTAHPNSPWLRCEPAKGRSSDAPQTATILMTEVNREPRLHRGAVTFRTDTGHCRTVMVDARVYAEDYVALAVEAEGADLSGTMETARDPSASNGTYIHGVEDDGDDGAARFNFDVPHDGVYYVVARAMVPGSVEDAGGHDSFWLAVDDGERLRWDLPMWSAGTWLWGRASGYRSRHEPFRFVLRRGKHTVTIGVRETLARLDRLVVTNAPYARPASAVEPNTD
jgi:hypothetical protein